MRFAPMTKIVTHRYEFHVRTAYVLYLSVFYLTYHSVHPDACLCILISKISLFAYNNAFVNELLQFSNASVILKRFGIDFASVF